MTKDNIHIVIDTREQTPWSFPEWVTCSISKVNAGDYALFGDEHFAIERKSADDFVGTISTGWARFGRELKRMDEAKFPAKVIIVESDFITFCFQTDAGKVIPPDHGHFMITPQFLMKRIGQLTMMGVSILFAVNPDLASAVALRILLERKNQIKQEQQERKWNSK